jgi:hypothetical protein
LHFAVLLPELFGDSPHSWFGAKPAGGQTGFYFPQRCWCFGRLADFGSPVTIIAARTTKRFGRTRRPAPSVSRAKLIWANVRFRSSCRTCTAIFFISRSIFIVILTIDVWKALWFAIRHGILGSRWHDRSRNQCDSAERLYFWVHSLAPLERRISRSIFKIASMYTRLRLCELFQSRHMLWAWLSLFWVGFSDLYVRLCSMGIWHDWRIV